MAADEQDWIDRAMAQDAWEPPDGFTGRVVVAAMAEMPPPRVRTFSWEGIVAAVSGFSESLRGRLELSAWVVRQYRDLMLHW